MNFLFPLSVRFAMVFSQQGNCPENLAEQSPFTESPPFLSKINGCSPEKLLSVRFTWNFLGVLLSSVDYRVMGAETFRPSGY